MPAATGDTDAARLLREERLLEAVQAVTRLNRAITALRRDGLDGQLPILLRRLQIGLPSVALDAVLAGQAVVVPRQVPPGLPPCLQAEEWQCLLDQVGWALEPQPPLAETSKGAEDEPVVAAVGP